MKKNLFSVCCILLVFTPLIAQKMEIIRGVLWSNHVSLAHIDTPASILLRNTNDVLLSSQKDYTPLCVAFLNRVDTSATGSEEYGYWWDISFPVTGTRLEFQTTKTTHNVNDLLRLLLKYKLLRDDAIDTEALNLFIARYGKAHPFGAHRAIDNDVQVVQQALDNTSNTGLVQRDRTKPVQVKGNKIFQSGTFIARFTYHHAITLNRQTSDRVEVFLPNGTRLGEAFFTGFDTQVKEFFSFHLFDGTIRDFYFEGGRGNHFPFIVAYTLINEGVL